MCFDIQFFVVFMNGLSNGIEHLICKKNDH